jgi:hypothetical protein
MELVGFNRNASVFYQLPTSFVEGLKYTRVYTPNDRI